MNFTGTGAKLVDADFARAAETIGYELAAIKVVMQRDVSDVSDA